MANYSEQDRRRKKQQDSTGMIALKIVGKILVFVLVTLLVFIGTLYLTLTKIKNSSEAARNLLITTLMESGQLKFVAHMVCSDEEIEEIVSVNSMQTMDVDQDTSLIEMDTTSTATDAVADVEDEEEHRRDIRTFLLR